MRQLFFSTTTLMIGLGLGSALGADLPMRSAPPVFTPVPVYNWSGFYVGVNAGVGWANGGNVTVADPKLGPQSINVSSHSGFLGGGQIGTISRLESSSTALRPTFNMPISAPRLTGAHTASSASAPDRTGSISERFALVQAMQSTARCSS
jgi:hypothetical protein